MSEKKEVKKIIIVGGVAGGASAAARIRRLDENAQITVFERTGYISYANCGLPYYIGGSITEKSALTLQTPESFLKRFRVEMKVLHEVTAIHPEKKTVSVTNLNTGESFEAAYDKLLLSPGARPISPAGTDLSDERIFTLRTVEDTFAIKDYIDQKAPRSAVIAGGGYIGLEMAENLTARGIDVTIIQRPDQLLKQLDADMASFVHAKVRSKNISLQLGCEVSEFIPDRSGIITVLKDGRKLLSDMVLVALGVTPDTMLAQAAGLAVNAKGAIVVNDRMETSVPDIYAVGDAVEIMNPITGQAQTVPLAGPANKQGRIAADNICGLESRFKGTIGSSIVKVFDLTAACTGLNEKTAGAAGISFDKVVLSPASHAGYYPGSKVMTMKVLFEPESHRLLGAQIVGSDGVDKRIDVLAAAVFCGMKGEDLKDLDLAYAPPYSSAKDPVNMAGYMIENLVNGLVKQFHVEDLKDLPADGSIQFVDVRTPREYENGHIAGFDRNIPVDELRERITELDPSRPVYVNCQSAIRSYIACRILSQYGFECRNFSGGYRFYESVTKEALAKETALPCGMEIS